MMPTATPMNSEHKIDLGKLDKGINALPQVEYLESLLAKLQDPNSIQSALAPEVAERHRNGDFQYDVIVENQRGAYVFGISMFSKNSLISPFDPPTYQTIHGNAVSDIALFPLPDFTWKWAWPWWSIAMVGDVDEQGFAYSRNSFDSRKWHGVHRFGNSIRRRIWIRKRERISEREIRQICGLEKDATGSPLDSRLQSHDISRVNTGVSVGSGITTGSLAQTDSLVVKKMRKRDRLRKKIRRSSRGVAHTGEIEFINNDSTAGLLCDGIAPYTATENGSDVFTDAEEGDAEPSVLTVEDRLNQQFEKIAQLQLDRQKIESVVQFLDTDSNVFVVAILNEHHTMFVAKVADSFYHQSSKKILAEKIQQLADARPDAMGSELAKLAQRLTADWGGA